MGNSTLQQLTPTTRPGRTAVTAALAGLLSLGVTATALPAGADDESSAPDAARSVDLTALAFSNPTNVTNPLFPASIVTQAVQLGAEGDVSLRHDITILEETRTIRWNGQAIESLVVQFMAYGDGELLEIATDYYAQADDGTVWYLGEDVANYEDGEIENNDGTWLAGRDGTAGVIMPASPRVGDVYLPENIPGFAFEEVTVAQTDATFDGPSGPVPGAMVVQERLQDGTLEDKVFAPGYGEFSASVPADGELVTVAVAVPTDAADGDSPWSLERLCDTARTLSYAAEHVRWSQLVALGRTVGRAWDQVSAGDVPPLLDDQVSDAVESLDSAIESRSRSDLTQAAIDLELAALDIEMLYEEPAEVDEDRLEVWRIQLAVHEAEEEDAAAASDQVIIDAIGARIP